MSLFNRKKESEVATPKATVKEETKADVRQRIEEGMRAILAEKAGKTYHPPNLPVLWLLSQETADRFPEPYHIIGGAERFYFGLVGVPVKVVPLLDGDFLMLRDGSTTRVTLGA